MLRVNTKNFVVYGLFSYLILYTDLSGVPRAGRRHVLENKLNIFVLRSGSEPRTQRVESWRATTESLWVISLSPIYTYLICCTHCVVKKMKTRLCSGVSNTQTVLIWLLKAESAWKLKLNPLVGWSLHSLAFFK